MQLDWRLKNGIATPVDFAVLLVVLFAFPWVLHETDALRVAGIDPVDPRHTPAFLHFCFVVLGYLWTCFAICPGWQSHLRQEQLSGCDRQKLGSLDGCCAGPGSRTADARLDAGRRKSVEPADNAVAARCGSLSLNGCAQSFRGAGISRSRAQRRIR